MEFRITKNGVTYRHVKGTDYISVYQYGFKGLSFRSYKDSDEFDSVLGAVAAAYLSAGKVPYNAQGLVNFTSKNRFFWNTVTNKDRPIQRRNLTTNKWSNLDTTKDFTHQVAKGILRNVF